jgi:CheY-like chemotaxis protein
MGKVLFVEDNSGCQQAISIALRAGGFEVMVARDAGAALSYLDLCRPDVILLDMVMPGMSGVDFLARIRREPRWRELPVIIFTASTDVSLKAQAEALGVEGFFIKAQISIKSLRAELGRYARQPHSASIPPTTCIEATEPSRHLICGG